MFSIESIEIEDESLVFNKTHSAGVLFSWKIIPPFTPPPAGGIVF